MAKSKYRHLLILRAKSGGTEYVSIFAIAKSGNPQFKESYTRTGSTQDLIDHLRGKYGDATLNFYRFDESIR